MIVHNDIVLIDRLLLVVLFVVLLLLLLLGLVDLVARPQNTVARREIIALLLQLSDCSADKTHAN